MIYRGDYVYKIYIVEPGETIESIARDLKISPDVLYDINGFNSNRILEVGDQIIIPTANSNYTSYVVKRGDNPYSIAEKFNIKVDELLTINGLEKDDYIYPNQELMIPNMSNKYYLTKNNDTIGDIINNLGMPFEKISEMNKTIYVLPDQMIFYN